MSSVLSISSEYSESLCMSCKKPCRALPIPVLQGTASCVCKVQAAWHCMTTFSLAQEDVLCTGSGSTQSHSLECLQVGRMARHSGFCISFFFGGEVMHPKINNFFVPANNILDHHTASFRFRGSSPGIFSGFHAGLDYPHHLSTCKRTVKVDAWLALPLAWLPPDN